MLLGGEPLLNPDLIDIMSISRDELKNTVIYLYTNGLCFPRMEDVFWETCNKLNINIRITQYPVNFDYTKWERYAADKGVMVSYENPEPEKTTIKTPLVEKDGLNPYKNYIKCYHANHCIVLRDGRLYTCPFSAWIDILNRYYDTKFPELIRNSISIYDVDDKSIVEEFLRRPNPLCSFCHIDHIQYEIPWDVSKRKREEWIER